MAPFYAALRKPIWCKMFVYGINGKIFWVLRLLCAPASNLSLKTPILVALITKW